MDAGIVAAFYEGGKRGIICSTVDQIMSVYQAAYEAFPKRVNIGHATEENAAIWLKSNDDRLVVSLNLSDPHDRLGYADVSWNLREGWDIYGFSSVFDGAEIDSFDLEDILG